jgi:rhamnulokinase
MRDVTVAAVDLGASSGRVMVGRVGPDGVRLREAHRFANVPVRVGATLHWDVLALYRGVLDGLRAAGRQAGRFDSIGIDTWAVDYGLLDADGALLGNPVHHRDGRTDGVMDDVLARVPAVEIYTRTGLQFLPINTLYQLVAAADGPQMAIARHLLLLPDLLAYWLTGERGAEVTNASTTQLLDVRARAWATDLMERVDIPAGLFPPLREPGGLIGHLQPSVREATGLGEVPVTAVGSHDTASAVVGVPAADPRFAFISSGTWSLVGVELHAPVLSEASRRANFTNELGVDGTVRYLRNVMGLWLLQESLRVWEQAGARPDLDALLRAAAQVPAFRSVVDPDDPVFLPPGDMPARIAAACERSGQPAPATQAHTVRCILDSLALAYRRTVRDAQRLAHHDVDVVHLVGGGSRNALLCQLTADACGLPVVAGPVEATALGNVLVQARALGALSGGLHVLRRVARGAEHLRRYEASGDAAAWDAAAARLDTWRGR